LLRRDPDIGSITECESGMQAIESIRKSEPQPLPFSDGSTTNVDPVRVR
jgi:hypothetical protein